MRPVVSTTHWHLPQANTSKFDVSWRNGCQLQQKHWGHVRKTCAYLSTLPLHLPTSCRRAKTRPQHVWQPLQPNRLKLDTFRRNKRRSPTKHPQTSDHDVRHLHTSCGRAELCPQHVWRLPQAKTSKFNVFRQNWCWTSSKHQGHVLKTCLFPPTPILHLSTDRGCVETHPQSTLRLSWANVSILNAYRARHGFVNLCGYLGMGRELHG